MDKRIIIDLSSTKAKKTIAIFGIAILALTAFFIYYFMEESPEIEPESQITSSEDVSQQEEPQDKSIYIDVSGAVKEPSVIILAEGSRVMDAIEAAGGVTEEANLMNINRAEILQDGAYLYIPTNKEVSELGSASPGTSAGSSGTASVGTGNSQGKININTADSSTLQQLNGVGPATAEKIIDYRNTHGRFGKIEDLKKVSGIGDKTFEKLEPHICI